jgi:hypothetical protein
VRWLEIGVLVRRRAVVFAVVGIVAIVVGLANGLFAPQSYQFSAGVIAFLFVGVVVGCIAAVANLIRWRLRGSIERTDA